LFGKSQRNQESVGMKPPVISRAIHRDLSEAAEISALGDARE
jgi:hypothetical protein